MSDYSVPSFALTKENSITLSIPHTDATLTDQGYTYNQPGFTYNQAGWQYGGVTNFDHDLSPSELWTDATTPHLGGIYDIYSQQGTVTPTTTGIPLAPGWFLYITQ